MSHIEPMVYGSSSEMLNNYKRIANELRAKPKRFFPPKLAAPPPLPPPKPKVAKTLVAQMPRVEEVAKAIEESGVWSSLPSIMRDVAARHGVTVEDIVGPSRTYREMRPRLEFYFLAASYTAHSLVAIARRCNRDHTTVRSGILKYCRLHALPVPPRNIGPRPKSLDIVNSN